MNENNLYAAPGVELLDSESEKEAAVKFFPSARGKLLILYFATLGLYSVYWFYKNWSLQKSLHGEDTIPVLRALFYIFFTHSLFNRIEQAADEKNITKSWSAGSLATLFVVLTLVSNILDRISAKSDVYSTTDYVSLGLLFVLVYPLYLVQGTVNKVNNDDEGKLNSRFSIYNIIFLLIGMVFWLFISIAVFDIDVSFLGNYIN